jgi:hypothetical protein
MGMHRGNKPDVNADEDADGFNAAEEIPAALAAEEIPAALAAEESLADSLPLMAAQHIYAEPGFLLK